MKENPEMKWHQNPTIIILMLIIFFPVGIYFMWKNEMWSNKARWIITSIFVLIVIISYTGKDDLTSPAKASSDQISEKVTHSDVSEKKEISSSHSSAEKTRLTDEDKALAMIGTEEGDKPQTSLENTNANKPIEDRKPVPEDLVPDKNLTVKAAEGETKNEEEMSASSVLVGYDWVYPDMNDPIGAWKFSSDGSFNYSTTMFGGSTRRGTWKDLGNGQVELIYDDGGYVVSGDGGSGNVSARGTITILSKSKFKKGSTIYRRY